MARPRKANPATPSEAGIQRTCGEFLMLDGWRRLKTDPVSRREWGKGFGEKGMADDLFLRYVGRGAQVVTGRTLCEHLWVEWKSARGKVSEHQELWHAQERARGALTVIAGQDFPKTIPGFIAWYMESGLARRVKG